MAISYSFVDNKLYGTEDINNITKNLVGGGVAPFPSKDSYSLSDLNSLSAALVDSGVCRDGLKCSISNGVVTISEGVLYFENGVCLTVDDKGYEVEIPDGANGYICAYFDDTKQEADIIFCTIFPSGGFKVPLAKVTENGIVYDKRVFARSKVGTLGTNSIVTFTSSAENNCRYTGDLSRFNYALLLGAYSSGYTYYGAFDISAGKMIYGLRAEGGTPPGGNGYSSPYYRGYIGSNMDNLTIQIIDGELYVSKEGITVVLV